MGEISKYQIDLIGLKNRVYDFHWKINNAFFEKFEHSLIEKCSLECSLILNKKENLIEMDFSITGVIELVCDRSLDVFDHPINVEKRMLFKYGEEDKEIDDEVEIISRNRQKIDVAQFIYEYITTSIPLKKLHPRYNGESDESESMIYSTDNTEQEEKNKDENAIDPRWEKLKNLKNNIN